MGLEICGSSRTPSGLLNQLHTFPYNNRLQFRNCSGSAVTVVNCSILDAVKRAKTYLYRINLTTYCFSVNRCNYVLTGKQRTENSTSCIATSPVFTMFTVNRNLL